jgi:N-acetylmuramoyl-L-alanine amidase
MPEYKVKQGDCLSNIAHRYGLFWEKVWNHPKNSKLQEKRKDPNILHPGDVVFIPDKEKKEESGASEQKHRFRKKGVPEKLRIRFMAGNEPIANENYILDIDGEVKSGTTDGEGNLEESIPPNAKRAKLWLGEEKQEYEINLGYLDPIDELSGVQARLNNLGFNCGKVDGIKGPKTTAALKRFQKKHSLKETGEIDEQTRNALKNAHIN